MSSTPKFELRTNSLPAMGPAPVGSKRLDDAVPPGVATEQGKDVTAWYQSRYRGVVAAERLGGEALVLFDEGESYGVTRQTFALAGDDREVLLRSWVDHVPKSRIDPTGSLFRQWAA